MRFSRKKTNKHFETPAVTQGGRTVIIWTHEASNSTIVLTQIILRWKFGELG